MSQYLSHLVISEQTRPMAVPAERRLQVPEIRTFGSARIAYDIPDLTKIHRLIGYEPKVQRREIISKVIEYFRAQGS